MKKLLALILAAALALSLVACGGGSGAGDTNTPSAPSTPSGGNGDTTSTDTHSGGGEDSAKEEILANAQLFDLAEFSNAFGENKVRAEETYLGNSFKMYCIVNKIEDEYFDYRTNFSNRTFRVYLSKEELMELNVGEGVNIVGTIDSIGTERASDAPVDLTIINIKPAYYIDNTIYGVFMIESFISDNGKKEACIAKPIQMLYGVITSGKYEILFDEETISTLSEQDFIFASGTAYNGATSIELRNAELIVKGQDEITAYFEQMEN